MPLLPQSPRGRSALAVGLVAGVMGIAAAAGYLSSRPGDVSNPDVPFTVEAPPPAPPPEPPKRKGKRDTFVWGTYGYSQDRRRYFPAPASLRPPFHRSWKLEGNVLLEFPPAIGGGSLYLLKNNGALYAIRKRDGHVRWKRRFGVLAASSPAYRDGRVYVTILSRGKGKPGRVLALSARTGKVRWGRPLPSRSESSPLVHDGRIFFGAEDGSVYALRARDGSVAWKQRVGGAVKAALALADGKLYFGDYDGRVYALRASSGRKLWDSGTDGGRFGRSGQFYSTAAVAYGRVYLGNTDGRVYSFSTDDGKLAWAKRTDGYVYSSPAVAQVPDGKPTVYIGSYDGTFYALDARSGKVRWSHRSGGKISGAPTVVGDIVYFSDLGKKSTYGLGARTGRKVFEIRRGAYNPVVTDGDRIYLTGYSQVYALRPRR